MTVFLQSIRKLFTLASWVCDKREIIQWLRVFYDAAFKGSKAITVFDARHATGLSYSQRLMFYSHLRSHQHLLGGWGQIAYTVLGKSLGYVFSDYIEVGHAFNSVPSKQVIIGIQDCSLSLDDPGIRFFVDYLQFRTLLTHKDSGDPAEGIARCHQGRDLANWIIRLDPEAQWNDGLGIGVEDVIYSLKNSQRVMDQALSIKKVDDSEIDVHLHEKNKFFPHLIASLPVIPSDGRNTSSAAFQLTHLSRNTIYFERVFLGNGNINQIILRCYNTLPECFLALEKRELDLAISTQPFQLKGNPAFKSQPLPRPNCFWAIILNRNSVFADTRNCDKLRSKIPFDTIERCFTLNDPPLDDKGGWGANKGALHYTLEYQRSDSMQRMADIIAKSTEADLYDINRTRGDTPCSDAYLSMVFLGQDYNRIGEYFHSEGANNVFGYSKQTTDRLIEGMRQEPSSRHRTQLGGDILQMLEDDFAFIWLGDVYEYVISPLGLGYSLGVNSIYDLLVQMGDVNLPE